VRPRILAAIVGVALLAVAILAIPLGIRLQEDARAQSLERLERVASAATARIPNPLPSRANVTLPDLASDGALAVYDASGARRGGEGPLRADVVTLRALRGHANTGTAESAFVVAAPVVRGLRVVAAIRATEPIGVTDSQVSRQRLNIVWFAGAAVGVALLVGLWLSAVLARPLGRLRVAATRLGHGDFTVRAPRSGIAEADAVAVALDDTAERLEDLVERERTFSAHASHQLRTPLTALRLAVEAELEQPRPDPQAALHEVLTEADRLEQTIKDLLLLSRGSAERGPIDLQVVVHAAHDRWYRLFAAAGRPLRVRPPTGQSTEQPLEAHASSAALGQILDVLLDNALKHGAGAVQLILRAGTGGGAVIAVEDEGDGVAGDPNAVFSTAASGGHGFGLPLAAALANAEGARLRLARSGPAPVFELALL
jgi:signal transduction histidine kinase